jgi:hypothetical protein
MTGAAGELASRARPPVGVRVEWAGEAQVY